MPDVKSLPAYYVHIVAGHRDAVPQPADEVVAPTIAQRLRSRVAGLRLAGRRFGRRPTRPAAAGLLSGERGASATPSSR
jgi:hypothetical protein